MNTAQVFGVEIKQLKTFPDDRGFFREVIRFNDPFFLDGKFGQWSHSKMEKNVVKAWHYHHIQTDWWYISYGAVQTVLFDNREESPTFGLKMEIPMGDPEMLEGVQSVCVKIPPGVLHGLKVLTEEAHIFYITSETYNPNDEGRFPFNSEIVNQPWGDNVITAENDRRTFEPTANRQLIKL